MNRKIIAPALVILIVLSMSAVQAQPAQTPCNPGVSFWTLLDSVEVGYVSGRLSVDKLYAVCLPAPAKQSTSSYEYDPDVGGKLTTVVKNSSGEVLNTYVWYGESIGGLWELSRYKVIGGHQSVKPLTPGSYLLEFAANDKPFYRFPFSVVEGKNNDPYQPAGARYFIEGAWSEYGNIFYQRNDPESALKFTTWLQDRSGKPATTLTPYKLELVSLKDKKVIAEDSGAFRLAPRWQKADLLLHSPGNKNAFTKAGELLRADGRYVFQLTVDGKPYGNYPFEVKEGRIQFQGRQVREKNDPMNVIVDYMGGGKYSSWWIKREP